MTHSYCPCGCGLTVSREGKYRRKHAPIGSQYLPQPPSDVVVPSDRYRVDEHGKLYYWWETRQKRIYNVRVKDCVCGRKFVTKQPSRDIYCTKSCSAQHRPPVSGERHYNWKGGRYINSGGYVVHKRGRIQKLEHRLVMERLLGRPLRPDENVHHINGDKADNRPENLELWSTSQPSGQRVTDKVAWAREILRLYGDLASANT